MDLVKLITDSNVSKETCFLCFKRNVSSTSVFEVLEIHDFNFSFTTTLSDMMRSLFPNKDIVFSQACEKCSNLIIRMYILLHRNNIQIMLLKIIIGKLDKQISERNIKGNNLKKIKLKINIPAHNNIDMDNFDLDSNVIVAAALNCNNCTMTLKSKEKLESHKKLLHKNRNEAVVCETCGKVCKTPQSLKVHLNGHKQKQCPYCSKVLKAHSHYKLHLKTHKTGVKRQRKQKYYNCHHCEYRSVNKITLEAHINKTHLCIRPYICNICFKGFYKKSNLTEHITIHEKVRNETCEFCGDNFGNKKTLTEHLRLHSNEKPYQCNLCDMTFVTSGRRSDHVKRKHMEKTECCLVCEKRFSLRKELNRHMKKVHWQNTALINAESENYVQMDVQPTYNYVQNNLPIN